MALIGRLRSGCPRGAARASRNVHARRPRTGPSRPHGPPPGPSLQCPRRALKSHSLGVSQPRGEGFLSMPKVTFISDKEKREVEVPEGANLREEAIKAGLPVYKGLHRYLNCRGLGLCG